MGYLVGWPVDFLKGMRFKLLTKRGEKIYKMKPRETVVVVAAVVVVVFTIPSRRCRSPHAIPHETFQRAATIFPLSLTPYTN